MMEAEQASYWNGIYAPKLTTGPDEWQSDDILDGSLPSSSVCRMAASGNLIIFS